MNTEIQKYHDFLLEDHETLIPPIFMEDYVESKQTPTFSSFVSRIPVQVKALAFGLAFATIGFITTLIGISK